MIEVGEYVRTKRGYISKITEIDNYIWFDSTINKESGMAVYELSKVEFTNLVVKHSPKLIDLIECGDYVNGKKIKLKSETGNFIIPKHIKNIVTKEQFKSVEYRIKEEQ